MSDTPRKNLSPYVGTVLVAMGVVLSAAVLERIVLPEGTLVGTTRRAAAWGICRITLISAGTYILLRRPKLHVTHLCAFAIMSVFSAACGAAILQLFYRPPPVYCGWKAFAVPSEQNQVGFRGRSITYSPEDFVIVLLGDSNVEAMALPMDAMPERRLEAHLRSLGKPAKVFSIGAGGYGQDQQLLALQEYFKLYRADLVVLWQTPANDVWNNLFKTHIGNRNPKPTFWLEDGKLRGPSEALGQRMAASPIVIESIKQRVFDLPRRDRDWERILPSPYVPLDHYEGPVMTEWQERWDRDYVKMRSENLASEKNHFAVTLAPRSPRMQYGLDLTRALLHRIQDMLIARQAALAIFQADANPFASDEDQIFVLNGKYYRVSKRQFHENFKYIYQGFETYTIPVTTKAWRVSPEDGHFNQTATDQIMEDLARRLSLRPPTATPTNSAVGASLR